MLDANIPGFVDNGKRKLPELSLLATLLARGRRNTQRQASLALLARRGLARATPATRRRARVSRLKDLIVAGKSELYVRKELESED